ncbi:MAG: EfeM/EfeO family lipoprotein [Chloroflexi bacterium]|nr:EfeM/EfeO family lipoprotein [Chloroflexota bacterium]
MKSLVQLYVGVVVILAMTACSTQAAPAPATPASTAAAPRVDLAGIKTYLTGKAAELTGQTQKLKDLGTQYYDLARAANFDYAALWKGQSAQVKQIAEDARAAWKTASPLYEQMEGIVAGTPSLADYDVILDAGASGEEDPDNAVPFDLALPDGRVLPRPGNLFGVTEATLWGTFADYTAPNASADFDGDGQIEFDEALPEANVFKAAADTLDGYAVQLRAAAQAWQPTESDAFTALVVMVPTMSEYFDSWKNSRFVLGDTSTQRDFVAISRLADIQDILSSLQVVYQNVSPLVQTTDVAQGQQIAQALTDLKAFVAGVYQQEQSGKRFTPEEADLLGAEAQNRATAITGQVAQVAAKLNITVKE